MSKETWIVVLGIVVAVMPFLGFPGSWKIIIYIVLGLAIAALALLLQFRKSSEVRSSLSESGRRTDSYVENGIKSEHEGREPQNIPR